MPTEYQTEWDLSRFYSGLNDSRLGEDVSAIVPTIRAFAERFAGRIANADTETIIEYYHEDARIHDLLQKPGLYLLYR
ncbi:MAG TPA: hypothetical protein PK765_03620 [bacterium]|nr:hypothetical protein [bacterium]